MTEFSTCRYCSTPYDGSNKSWHQKKQSTIWDWLGENPLRTVFTILTILSIPASIYLASEFRSTNGSANSMSYSRHRRGSFTSVPAALIYYFSKRAADKAGQTITETNSALTLNPKDYDALMKRADAHWTRMEVSDAFNDYTSAIAVKPNSPDAYDKRADIYDAMSNHDLAEKDRATARTLRHW